MINQRRDTARTNTLTFGIAIQAQIRTVFYRTT